MNAKKTEVVDPNSYSSFLSQIKTDIQESQLRAAVSLTTELTALYWRIGKGLIEKINLEGWGAKTIDRLAKKITSSFSDASSYSRRNLYFMKQFANECPDGICETAVSQLASVDVSSYKTQIIESLPDTLKGSLPSIEEIEEDLSRKVQPLEESPV